MSSGGAGPIELGPGLIIVAGLCLGSLTIALILSRTDGAAKLAGVVLVPIAVLISIVLWFSPQQSATEEAEIDLKKYDPTYYTRTLILALLSITFVVALLFYAIFDILEPIYAKPLKKVSY